MKQFLLYRIYYDFGIAYVGQTAQPLKRRLHGHFFAKPMMRKIDPRHVVRIEYAICKSRADMKLYEIYYIEKLKPPLNFADKNRDKLSVTLPDIPFLPFDRDLLSKWCAEIEEREQKEAAARNRKEEIAVEKIELRRQFHKGAYTEDEYFNKLEALEVELNAIH